MATMPDTLVIDRKGPLILRRTLARDASAHERIIDMAFANSLGPLFYNKGKHPEDYAWSRKTLQTQLVRDSQVMKHLVVVDTSAAPLASDLEFMSPSERLAAEAEGKIVGISVWRFYNTDRTQEDIEAEQAKRAADGRAPNANTEMQKDFFGAITACKEKHLGNRRYCTLHMLGTDPDYHRRGIGALHLKWGLDEADRLGLLCYLEGSENGKALYERWGFESIEVLPFDSMKYGGDKRIDHTIMIRPAKQVQ